MATRKKKIRKTRKTLKHYLKNRRVLSDARNKTSSIILPYPNSKPGEKRYIEFDNDFGQWGVFGDTSGHCYGLYDSETQAEKIVK